MCVSIVPSPHPPQALLDGQNAIAQWLDFENVPTHKVCPLILNNSLFTGFGILNNNNRSDVMLSSMLCVGIKKI